MRNRCTFFAVAITLAANLSAFAADMPVKALVYKAPPAAVVASIWTGFYAGLNAGAVWGRNDTSTINGPSKRITDDALALAILAGAGTDRGVGFIGGGQIVVTSDIGRHWR
jgi:outer membrane immunogenic protein